ncbi:unnamed protein product [Closterium sp. NIES-54]
MFNSPSPFHPGFRGAWSTAAAHELQRLSSPSLPLSFSNPCPPPLLPPSPALPLTIPYPRPPPLPPSSPRPPHILPSVHPLCFKVEAGFTPSRPLLLRLRRRCLCSGLAEGVARAEGLLQALRFRTVNADERRRRLHLAQLPLSVADPRLAARMQGGGQREGGQRWREERGEGQRWGRRRWGEQGGQEQQQWQEERRQEGEEAGSPGL